MPTFPDLPIQTERLLLRPLGPDDAAAIFAIFSHPQVMRYWSSPPWADPDDALAMVARDEEALASGEALRLGLAPRAGGPVVGTCSLFSIAAESRRAEVGYALHPGWWGQGLMHEALRALVGYAFAQLDLNRLEADIDPRNLASARSLGRLGFRPEGLLRERWIVAGEVSDSALYGLLRREWRAEG